MKYVLDAVRLLELEKEKKIMEVLERKAARHRRELEELLRKFVAEIESYMMSPKEFLQEQVTNDDATILQKVALANVRSARGIGIRMQSPKSSQSRGAVGDAMDKGKSVIFSSNNTVSPVTVGPAAGLLVPIPEDKSMGPVGQVAVGQLTHQVDDAMSEPAHSDDGSSVDFIRKRRSKSSECTAVQKRLQLTIPCHFGSIDAPGGSVGVGEEKKCVSSYGMSPFDMGLKHRLPSNQVCRDFYEDVMYYCGAGLGRIWFRHLLPWNLEMTGCKMKYHFGRNGEMNYNYVDASVRCFMEKEVEMMAGSSEPHWRHLAPPDLSLQFIVEPGLIDMEFVKSMFDKDKLGYSVKKCRMIMAPIYLRGAWCLYVFDMQEKCVTVLDPVFTMCPEDVYVDKHASSAKTMLRGLAAVGAEMEDGWMIDCMKWTTLYNISMHPACSSDESGFYIMHYAREFDGSKMLNQLPEGGIDSVMKQLLYEVMAMKGNVGEHSGFMVTIMEE